MGMEKTVKKRAFREKREVRRVCQISSDGLVSISLQQQPFLEKAFPAYDAQNVTDVRGFVISVKDPARTFDNLTVS
jgi:hypothetical protein